MRTKLVPTALLFAGAACAMAQEPAQDTSRESPQATAPAADAPATNAQTASASAANAQAANAEPKSMLGMSILGNQEAPKSLVIVPWKSSEIGNGIGVSRALDTSIRAVDKEVFMRELKYYAIRSGTEQ